MDNSTRPPPRTRYLHRTVPLHPSFPFAMLTVVIFTMKCNAKFERVLVAQPLVAACLFRRQGLAVRQVQILIQHPAPLPHFSNREKIIRIDPNSFDVSVCSRSNREKKGISPLAVCPRISTPPPVAPRDLRICLASGEGIPHSGRPQLIDTAAIRK